ncbi:glutathione S-transferase family protein [Candidatus Methylospira mobilis]|uniref:Glutathione S-transferase family protein n=1 Tax=Candidatus Methylospira mobilis TaxID=1808979 RepID=A0A5Q0BM43_9GAMM|nr:glutathione S-transferase family protein [Candidatus Methylospira mobilis]QFY44830.1 glutathione S-transferase family protein [Candidatus Methylospira mobilis]WNV05625.1 glutathione S-transferase family protein [Candidatus Methylospira mobilis]
MIKLYKFGPVGDVCDASPFCVKVEAYLKLAGIPYETLNGAQYLRKAPKGKLPYIEDNGNIVPDSSFILQYLKETYGKDIDSHLSGTDKAIAHAFIKMIDEHLYWVLVHARWALEHNANTLNKLFFGGIPFPLNKVVACRARNDVRQALYKQGIGRLSDDEIAEKGNLDLKALSDFLGVKDYFFGDKPTTLDITAYGILSQFILVSEFSAPIFDKAKSHENLVEFTNRLHKDLKVGWGQ